jgi:hypothetical protein
MASFQGLRQAYLKKRILEKKDGKVKMTESDMAKCIWTLSNRGHFTYDYLAKVSGLSIEEVKRLHQLHEATRHV